MKPGEKGLGLIGQSPPDHRDHLYSVARIAPPDYVDLRHAVNAAGRKVTPRIFDQGQLGSCTANAANAVVTYVEHKDGDPDWDRLSRLFTYWYSREKLGTTNVDSGALIRDAYKVLAERGAPKESLWPYDETVFDVKPMVPDWRATEHRVLEYLSIGDGNATEMRSCLASGYPFSFGFAVYPSFWDVGPDGRWLAVQGHVDGYHAVDCWGYDFRPGAFGFQDGGWIIRNSWGTSWGDNGYFYVPQPYMETEAFDCWTIRRVKK